MIGFQIYKCALLFSCVSLLYALDENLCFNSATATAQSIRITRSSQADAFPNQNYGFFVSSLQDSNADSSSQNVFIPSLPNRIQTGQDSSSACGASDFSVLLPNNNIPINQETASGSFPSFPGFSPLETYNFDDFTKTVLSIPALEIHKDFQIPGSEAASLFTDIVGGILSDLGHPDPAILAQLLGQPAALFEVLTLPIYIEAIGNSIETFLKSEGIPPIPAFIDNYVNIIENSLSQASIRDGKSLYKFLNNANVAFIQTLGFDILEKAEKIMIIWNSEVAALQSTNL